MTDIMNTIIWKFGAVPGVVVLGDTITSYPGGIPSQADQDKWTAEYEAQIPAMEWKKKMIDSDSLMPRYLEDHLRDDHDGVAGNEFLQAKYDEKKLLRSEKP